MRAHLILKGRVQGIGFRSFARRKAEELKIKGIARNVSDDSLEIIAEGAEENLKRFIEACRKGPLLSHVKEMNVKFENETGEFEGFWEIP